MTCGAVVSLLATAVGAGVGALAASTWPGSTRPRVVNVTKVRCSQPTRFMISLASLQIAGGRLDAKSRARGKLLEGIGRSAAILQEEAQEERNICAVSRV